MQEKGQQDQEKKTVESNIKGNKIEEKKAKKEKTKEDKKAGVKKEAAKKSGKKKEPQTAGEKAGFMILSIRNKIILCFLVPIAFMIIIGVSAYQKAAEGMSDKFLVSTMQTLEMATDYIDMSCTFIEAEGMKYAFNDSLSKY